MFFWISLTFQRSTSLEIISFFEFHWLSRDLQVLKWLDFLSFIDSPAILHRSRPWPFMYFIRDTQNHRIFGWHPIFHNIMRWRVTSQTQQSWWFSFILSLKMNCFFEFHWLSSDLQVLKLFHFLNFIDFPAIYKS